MPTVFLRALPVSHHYQTLITLFDSAFFTTFNTRLVKGDDEPLYQPSLHDGDYHRVIFAHGFYTSALHEIAHWCLAGKARRALEDYGYWYCPDGRDQQQQYEFEQVEVKPQAIEWAFCIAAGIPFNVSVDNLNGFQSDRQQFQSKVAEQAIHYLYHGFPQRAQQFIDVLRSHYDSPELSDAQFTPYLAINWEQEEKVCVMN